MYTPPGVTDTPISPRLIGSVPCSLPHSPGSMVTTSRHSSPVPLDMWLMSTGLSSMKNATTCWGR